MILKKGDVSLNVSRCTAVPPTHKFKMILFVLPFVAATALSNVVFVILWHPDKSNNSIRDEC
ncbi:hypothetical protein WN55_02407 [Dufourea novaeangliae]|uniref:Uncharacterized protein n=1 Tax=Dufourea novaeangliae TaxID=178035 RepID=A0A154PGW1_DUFNO|nr:hypothetical protein WN55_02407 [Dufourea novaeangliae]